MAWFSAILGNANLRVVKDLEPLVVDINAREADFEKLSDAELQAKTVEFKKRIEAGELLNDLLPEAFAAVREASKRTLGQRHFDVQLMGGAVLHQGRIAEMRTGEGKTLVATLPSYLNALSGNGVHIVTVNDYLSRRDAVWMGQIYAALGLSTAVINHDTSYIYDTSAEAEAEDAKRDLIGGFKIVYDFLRPVTRQEAYRADITYGTNNEYAFDYLRDNMVYAAADKRQRGFTYAIVDEVDSILIDEARTPLIISAPDEESGELYKTFSRIVPRLKRDADYTVDEKLRAVSLTEPGIDKLEEILGKKLYEGGHEAESMRLVHHVEQALKAETLFLRDRDYVLTKGEVIIVDEFTGRLMPGRRWSEGLHQAIEAKESVEVQKESRTLATVTFQNYFRMYKKLAGMTGTAATNAEEFHKVYNLDVVTIPTHRENVRQDLADLVFRTEKGKFLALARKIKSLNEAGAPVLIGTVSIEKNERLAEVLKREGVPHEILNAKNHEKEAEVIAQAGAPGAVTVATNLAGRGVDIILGGNPPASEDAEKVKNLGGLHVFGTERHEARRIDNQLRGRSGRQGDPGATQFYLSLDDDLMRIFGSGRIKKMMESFGIPEDEPIENKMVSKAIESAQAKIEGFHFDARKHVLEFDDVMNRQREAIYRLRSEILESGEDKEKLQKRVFSMIDEEASIILNNYLNAEDLNQGIDELKQFMQVFLPEETDLNKFDELKELNSGELFDSARELVAGKLKNAYQNKAAKFGEGFMTTVRASLLQTIDMFWMDHLTTMDHLRDSVRLRAYGQRDPLVEYKNESVRLFRMLQGTIRQYALQIIFRIGNVERQAAGDKRQAAQPSQNLIFESAKNQNPESGINNQGMERPASAKALAGRNDPCPCGSGKKYKRCHGA
ncbi:MAG: preprotein translocase subunit SecA [Candidatus Sungbacteria bacterium]|uniref:Protein translocase subunit SecA n=1 Tax=Candidatus Sungiibacteriota bacterium TaxID=2750080 RepID=A0A9D6LR90_9BACT|nr:preprotein translocase subunit SecA [Candidatus Sungbacteria bacterium]